MKVEVTGSAALEVDCSLLAIPLFEEEVRQAAKGLTGEIDRKLGGHLTAAVRDEQFEGRPDEALALSTLGRIRADRLLLVGLGRHDGAETRLPLTGFEALRLAAGRAARVADKLPSARLAVVAPRLAGQAAAEARAIVEGALLDLSSLGAGGANAEPELLAQDQPPGNERVRVRHQRRLEAGSPVLHRPALRHRGPQSVEEILLRSREGNVPEPHAAGLSPLDARDAPLAGELDIECRGDAWHERDASLDAQALWLSFLEPASSPDADGDRPVLLG